MFTTCVGDGGRGEPPAYTVSFVGDEERDEGGLSTFAAAATDIAFRSCWNHLSRARRLTAATSFVARGRGIWRVGKGRAMSCQFGLTFIMM